MNLKSIRSRILTQPLVEKTYHRLINPLIDAYIISFPKSGRTWVRMLLAQALSLEFNQKLNLDLYKMTLGSGLANIKTDPRTGNYRQAGGSKSLGVKRMFKNKKIIFLVRDPKDVLVSYYYEWTRRRDAAYEGKLAQFIREEFTLPAITEFMNSWAEEMERRPQDFLLVAYENLHRDPKLELQRMLNFLAISVSESSLTRAVEASSFDRMLQMEKINTFAGDHRLQAVNLNDQNSFKMRKGKVGGFKEILTGEDLSYVNSKLAGLNRRFGY
ncbi:MAG TPA: sulfotransferase domain-containing protein [Candidatus Nanoarchaeia archaeon]|nr:sulfotransferase domain-containing protein [Candidatus Nanoarchaeia archaeon]